jgi:hypothetical protein
MSFIFFNSLNYRHDINEERHDFLQYGTPAIDLSSIIRLMFLPVVVTLRHTMISGSGYYFLVPMLQMA